MHRLLVIVAKIDRPSYGKNMHGLWERILRRAKTLDEMRISLSQNDNRDDRWAEAEIKQWALIDALPISEDDKGHLYENCKRVLSSYISMKQARKGRADYARTRTMLKKMSEEAQRLSKGFSEIAAEAQIELIYGYLEAPGVENRENPPFWPTLQRDLEDLSAVALWVYKNMPARRVGAPGGSLQLTTLASLVSVVEHFVGQPVRFQRTKNSVDDPHFVGVSGEFVRDIFLLADPTLNERQLANAFRNLSERRELRGRQQTEN